MSEPEEVTFDLPTMVLHMVAGASAREQELALDYWGHYVDEQGQLTWAHRVADVESSDSALSAYQSLLKISRAVATVECKFLTCRTCGETYRPDARSHVPVADVFNPSWVLCAEHLAEEKVKREAECDLRWAKIRAEERERAAAKAAAKAAAARAAVARASAALPELSQPKPPSYADLADELTWDAVQELFARPRDLAWADDALMLTRLAITREAGRYYEHRVARGDRPLLRNQDREGRVKSILFEHAARASIGQFYAILWLMTIADDEPTAQARAASQGSDMDFTCKRLQGYLQRFEPEPLTTKHYGRVYGLDLADATEDLYKGLSLDPITATPAQIAAAIKSQLDPDRRALNSIVRGVSEEEYSRAWANIEGLSFKLYMTTQEGVELSVNADTFFEFLHSGFSWVHNVAEVANCTHADAFRSAYFGVLSRSPDSEPGRQIMFAVQQFVRESVDGTTNVDTMFEAVMTDGWPAPPRSSSSPAQPILSLVR